MADKTTPKRGVSQRFLSATMVMALALIAFLAGFTWFIHSFILPPRAAISNPADVAAPNPPSTKAALPEPAMAPPSTAQPQSEASAGLPDSIPASSGSVTTATNTADVDPATTGSAPHGTAAAPISAPMPLPRPRQQEFVTVAGPMPPPRPRQQTRRTRTNLPIYNRHRAE